MNVLGKSGETYTAYKASISRMVSEFKKLVLIEEIV